MYISKTTIVWTLFIGIMFYTININSFAVEKCGTSNILVIDQQTFLSPIEYTKTSLTNIIEISLAGKEIKFNQLSKEVKKQLFRIKKSVIPHLELKDASPQDMVMAIVSKPIPIKNVRLGIISLPNNQTSAPIWLSDIEFDNKKIQCIATNISLLNLSFVFADVFNCEFGITTNGEAMFRNKSVEAKAKYPFYLIKPLKQSSSIIKEEVLQKENERNSIIVFMTCSVALIIVVLTVLFFWRHRKLRSR